MNMKNCLLCLPVVTLFFSDCALHPQKLDLIYLKDGELHTESITLDFIDKDGTLHSPYHDDLQRLYYY